MGCDLKKFETYDVGRVVHDNSTGRVTVQILHPPHSCPDNSFSSKNAEIKEVPGANPVLMFDRQAGHPVVMVPRSDMVEQVGSAHGVGFWLMIVLAVAGIIGIVWWAVQALTGEEETPKREEPTYPQPPKWSNMGTETGRTQATQPNYSAPPRSDREPGYTMQPSSPIMARQPYQAPAPAAPAQTVVVNNNTHSGGGSDGLLTGVLIGEMMASGRREDRIIERDRVVEREVVREVPVQAAPAPTDDSDDDDNSSSSRSDSSDSYSSDSSDSYSSSNSDSYSSDSSSSDSFSSDDN